VVLEAVEREEKIGEKMKKRMLLILLLVLCFPISIFAETIVLKSGQSVEGKLIEKTDKYIKIDFQGVPLTYFLDEIESVKGESHQSIPRKEDNITSSQLGKNPLSEDKNLERQQVLEYINKSDSIIKSMNTEIAKNQALLAQASMIRDMEKMRIITTEMRDIKRQHKEKFLSLSMPSNCEPLHTATLNWFRIQEDIHNELINGNIEQAKILTKQLFEAYEIMAKESNRLIQNYE